MGVDNQIHGRDSITTGYAGNYEKIIHYGRIREFYYLDGGVIVVTEQNGAVKPYISFSDCLGSILSVFDETVRMYSRPIMMFGDSKPY